MYPNSRNVLVVEDNAALRQGLALLLRNLGYAVTTASTVADGLAMLDGQGVALLDLRLPDGSGDELLREIRSRRLPMRVAVMSAGAEPAIVQALDRCPPDRYFEKPLDIDALAEWVGEDEPPRAGTTHSG